MADEVKRARIYLIEDHTPDVFLVEKALHDYGIDCDLVRFVDGGQALVALNKLGDQPEALPDLILLDLNLPRVSGMDILRVLQKDPALAKVPVAILTSSQAPRDKLEANTLGVTRFITKPNDLRAYLEVIARAIKELLSQRAGGAPA